MDLDRHGAELLFQVLTEREEIRFDLIYGAVGPRVPAAITRSRHARSA